MHLTRSSKRALASEGVSGVNRGTTVLFVSALLSVTVVACVVSTTAVAAQAAPATQVVGSGLANPTMFTIAPDGRVFFSELTTGRIKTISPADGTVSTYFEVPNLCTSPNTDQGIFGLALHPDFPQDSSLYAYAVRHGADGSCQNQVLRIAPTSSGPLGMTVLLSDPYVAGHIGGRLLFGPDRNLYISTGDGSSGLSTVDANKAQRAETQNTVSLKGKILRMTATGGVPADNPFGNYVFAYGFRNVFGSDFDPSNGQLWVTDNGPDPAYPGDAAGPGPNGGCNDEINLVTSGANYGWGPNGGCGKPPDAPLNSNQDGPNPVLPQLNIEAATGITGARFCSGCGLGPDVEGRLLYVKYNYNIGLGEIRAATLSADRRTITTDALLYRTTGSSPLSLERGPDGAIYFSDSNSIQKLTPATPAPAATGTPFVSSFTPTYVHSDFEGWVGMQLQVGAQDLVVSSLGRWVVPGDSQTHAVKVVDAATGADVPGASATVATAGAAGGSFAYAPLAAPVTLRANTAYLVVSFERSGGDRWYNAAGIHLVTTADASVPGYAYSLASTPTSWVRGGSPTDAYGPPNLLYTVASGGT